MLTIQPNSRQIPSKKTYTANKKYNDKLYGILQEMSYLEESALGEKFRYVDKKDIVFTDLAKRMGLSRQCVSTRFKNLLTLELIEFIESENRYRLTLLHKEMASLVPIETLKKLNNTLKQHSISLYVYLLNCYIANGYREFQTTMAAMKSFIGISTSTTSNNEAINDILHVLTLLGLIEVEKRYDKEKTIIIVTKVNNTVKEVEGF